MSLPPKIPPTLSKISHYMKIASEHDQRDPVVAYWARFHTVQRSLKIDKSSPDCKLFIVQLLDWLEKKKKEMSANEAVTNEAVAEAHLENYALKLFKYADDSDRQSVFNKNTIKAFYTSSLLIDVLEDLGEIGEEFDKMRKYGKWKAAYIHNCLKNGEVPVGGPVEGGSEEEGGYYPASYDQQGQDEQGGSGYQVPTTIQPQPINNHPPQDTSSTPTLDTIALTSAASKYTRIATSALNFDDIPTAIINLTKALHLLQTGRELEE